ncbi:hypothetical protein Ahy_B09g096983 isoform E [Arachis hypogaea]|uniref:Aminotransferase-like plant mobile domain-containing protein n=1 Tax=Arachis hypogaea TaxID=3818 RepID=A0A444XN59_ARAHY|nr:hypothetical protein Ahy_B09g096983 isoform E [Arachis hypogaea]
MAGLAHFARLNNYWFRLDEPLVSAFVERWCSKNCIDKFTLKCTWMQETFSDLPEGADEETVRRYARACIMILLSMQLFNDKSGTHMHIRWLPYVARLKDMGRYSW